MTKELLAQKIIKYIQDEFNVEDENLNANCDIFEDGYIESVHLEKFFTFIENEFNILIDDDLFFDDRISVINGIAEIILEKRNQ
ncbi:MAG: hypothetical protein JXB88_15370 [Spirochaetales bacterium]|nr:hypothetical protein [Spirochaetales bacterium]